MSLYKNYCCKKPPLLKFDMQKNRYLYKRIRLKQTMDESQFKVLKEAVFVSYPHLTQLFGKSIEEIGTEYKVKDGDTPRTLIDTNVERSILAEIKLSGEFDDYAINAEESGELGEGQKVLYIDPFDGTSNAQIKLGMSVIGVSVAERGVLVGSVVLNPFEEKIFYAEKGKGAYFESLRFKYPFPLSTDLKANSAKERFAWVDAFFNKNTTPPKLEWIRRMQESSLIQNVRMTGSNIDYSVKIAEGRGHYQLTDAVGGYFDLCGYNLIEEAGGKMFNLEGKQPTPRDQVVAAVANPKDLEQVLEITRDCYKGYKGFR